MLKISEAQLKSVGSDPVEACDQTNRVVDIAGEDEILACCGLRYYEARFRRSASPAEKKGVHWELFDPSTKKPVEEPYEKEIRKEWILLRHLPAAWIGRKLELRAYLCDKEKEGKKTLAVKQSGVGEFIGLVKKVEEAYPDWSGERMANAIRRIAKYDDLKWQVLLGREGPADTLTPRGKLTQSDLDRLYRFTRHAGDVAGSETGVADDCLGRHVALGHVITGLCAGLYRNRSIDFGNELKPWYAAPIPVGAEVDNLYTATIAGDLGQSACLIHEKQQQGTVGDHTEATESELIGDIDGLLLGDKKGPSLAGEKLSEILKSYYCADDLDTEPLIATKRFALFSPYSGATLLDQSQRFAKNYIFGVNKLSGFDDLTQEVNDVYTSFFRWFKEQKDDEQKRREKAKKDYDLFKKR